ncbi:unnamed protein product, partial [Musa acuminata var. zebrina]
GGADAEECPRLQRLGRQRHRRIVRHPRSERHLPARERHRRRPQQWEPGSRRVAGLLAVPWPPALPRCRRE